MGAMGEIRIGYLSTLYHTSILIRGAGWLESEQIEPRWLLFGTGPAIVDALAKGKLDLAYIGLSPTLIGIGKGVPLKCIAGGHVEGTVVVAKGEYASLDSMSETLGQFRGKKLGAPRKGSLHDVFLRHYLSRYGLEDQVGLLNYDWADFMPDAIVKGEIEGAAGTPPFAVLSSRLFGGKIVVPPDKIWPNNPSYGIVTTKSLLREKPEILEKFLGVHKKASALLRENPALSSRTIAETVQLVDQGFVEDTLRVSPKYCACLSSEYVESTVEMLPVLKRLNYLQADLDRDDIFDFTLIDKVHPEPPHYSSSAGNSRSA